MVDKVSHFLGQKYREVASGFMTVLKDSKFHDEGVLTPEEFVIAGDYLTQKCPTWKWCSANTLQNIKPVEYLPKEKQFLITTVRCPRRAREYEKSSKTVEQLVEDDWVEANMDFYGKRKENEILDIENFESKNKPVVIQNNVNDDVDIEVIEETAEEKVADDIEVANEDYFVVEDNQESNVISTRTYDVTITYDFYYRVPRMWLKGYNEMGVPLGDSEISEDIMPEYLEKSVTFEIHPMSSGRCVSIHPCKHSILMKKMIENFELAGKSLEVHMSIVLLLKFLHSVVPTIQYDFTMDIDF
jgi:ubiquitin-like-conjugating enzyme ATG3